MARKVYVNVTADFLSDGSIIPTSFIWEDGRRFEIDRVLDIRPAASLKVGGQGMRYTCRIMGRNSFMFLEEGRWFMEAKA